MFDSALVTTGFDTETLLSERYIAYVLLAQVEAGLLPFEFRIFRPPEPPDDPGLDLDVTIHPSSDYERNGYDVHPDAFVPGEALRTFEVDLLFDHESGADARIHLFLTVTDNLTNESSEGGLELFARLDLVFDVDDRGFQLNHRLALEVVDIGGIVVEVAVAKGVDRDELLAEIKAVADRTVPFALGAGAVQRVALRKLPGGGEIRPALGVYVNLALRTGPEPDAFLDDRGDVANAQNFLADGRDLAFATSPGLYAALGPDAHARMAEEKENGGFHFPLRVDPDDPDSDVFGRVLEVRVRPEVTGRPNEPSVPTGRLVIHVKAEITDAPFDPDVHFFLFLLPQIEDGLLTWKTDTAFDSGLAATLLALAGGLIIGALTLNVGAGVGIFLSVMLYNELVVERVAAGLLADVADEQDLDVLEALPHRVTAATRRWDPLFDTRHQVVALLDENVRIDFSGIAFEGRAELGREPAPRRDAILRDEERNEEGEITHLRYRVDDFATFEEDFEALAPGTDRRPFRRADPEGEPTLVSLNRDQLADRTTPDHTGAPLRVAAPIALVPRRVHTHQGQIDDILCITRREVSERRRALIDAFRAGERQRLEEEEGDQIRAAVASELEDELGRPPTPGELANAVARRFERLIDQAEKVFVRDELAEPLRDAIDALLRFDLAPEVLAELQGAGVLLVEGKEIVVRKGKPYYRDRPDADTTDNLLALPRYQPPFAPTDAGGADLPDVPGRGQEQNVVVPLE